jgi:hypothetical protein
MEDLTPDTDRKTLDPLEPDGTAWVVWPVTWQRRPVCPALSRRYTLLSRARGADGSAQPDKHDPNYGSYVVTHPPPIEVFVDGPACTSG